MQTQEQKLSMENPSILFTHFQTITAPFKKKLWVFPNKELNDLEKRLQAISIDESGYPNKRLRSLKMLREIFDYTSKLDRTESTTKELLENMIIDALPLNRKKMENRRIANDTLYVKAVIGHISFEEVRNHSASIKKHYLSAFDKYEKLQSILNNNNNTTNTNASNSNENSTSPIKEETSEATQSVFYYFDGIKNKAKGQLGKIENSLRETLESSKEILSTNTQQDSTKKLKPE